MDSGKAIADRIIGNVETVIVGKRSVIETALVALICQGHLLIEDVPGVGKTVLAKSIARSVGCTFKRIQFTPDLLPTDITGNSIYNQRTGEFEFHPGPILSQIVLADEINRATPKTQSALLEAMEERQVTVDGSSYRLPSPFMVMATQNPIEYEGTFPLPEAQLDRFIVHISIGYPDRRFELQMLEMQRERHPVEDLVQVATVEDLLQLQQLVRDIYVDELVREYIVNLVASTRHHPDVYLGASPRGSLALFRTSQARALIQGRDFVMPDDVKALLTPTLAHRIIISPSARLKHASSAAILEEILADVAVPGTRVPK